MDWEAAESHLCIEALQLRRSITLINRDILPHLDQFQLMAALVIMHLWHNSQHHQYSVCLSHVNPLVGRFAVGDNTNLNPVGFLERQLWLLQ